MWIFYIDGSPLNIMSQGERNNGLTVLTKNNVLRLQNISLSLLWSQTKWSGHRMGDNTECSPTTSDTFLWDHFGPSQSFQWKEKKKHHASACPNIEQIVSAIIMPDKGPFGITHEWHLFAPGSFVSLITYLVAIQRQNAKRDTAKQIVKGQGCWFDRGCISGWLVGPLWAYISHCLNGCCLMSLQQPLHMLQR